MATLGQRIRELRQEMGLKQQEFADLIGVVKSAVSHYENDKNSPNDDLKFAMCNYFNVSLDYLMGRTDVRGKEASSTDQILQDGPSEYEEIKTRTELYFKNKDIPCDQKDQLMLQIHKAYWDVKM